MRLRAETVRPEREEVERQLVKYECTVALRKDVAIGIWCAVVIGLSTILAALVLS